MNEEPPSIQKIMKLVNERTVDMLRGISVTSMVMLQSCGKFGIWTAISMRVVELDGRS